MKEAIARIDKEQREIWHTVGMELLNAFEEMGQNNSTNGVKITAVAAARS